MQPFWRWKVCLRWARPCLCSLSCWVRCMMASPACSGGSTACEFVSGVMPTRAGRLQTLYPQLTSHNSSQTALLWQNIQDGCRLVDSQGSKLVFKTKKADAQTCNMSYSPVSCLKTFETFLKSLSHSDQPFSSHTPVLFGIVTFDYQRQVATLEERR